MMLSQFTAFVILGVALRMQGIDESTVSWSRIIVAWGGMSLASLIVPTPGGLGVAEAALAAILSPVIPESQTANMVSAIMLFRGATWFLPIPIGSVSYLFWRKTPRWRRTAEDRYGAPDPDAGTGTGCAGRRRPGGGCLMAFGQQSGPPASAKQLKYLLSLVQEAGHESFRDARHPLDLTQRQAGGKFTTREASELIDRLLAGEFGDPTDDDGPPSATRSERAPRLGTPPPSAPGAPGAASGRPAGSSDARADAAAARAQQRLDDQRGELLAGMPADLLVAELERRGWTATPPPD